MTTTNPVITVALAELRRRGVTVTSATSSDGVAVLVLNLDSVPVTPRAAECGRCGKPIPPHTGPGRPRQFCSDCRRPLGPRGEREALHDAAYERQRLDRIRRHAEASGK
jgi:recombinational DNA repair protein (RecF pathway)